MGWWGGAVVGARNKPLQRAPPADKPVHGVLFAGDYRKSLYSQAFGHLICRSGGSTIGTAANPRRPRLSPDVTRPDPAVPIDESLTPSMTHPSHRLCAATAHPQRVKPRRRHHRAREPYCEPSERAWRACVARPGGWRWEREREAWPFTPPAPLHPPQTLTEFLTPTALPSSPNRVGDQVVMKEEAGTLVGRMLELDLIRMSSAARDLYHFNHVKVRPPPLPQLRL